MTEEVEICRQKFNQDKSYGKLYEVNEEKDDVFSEEKRRETSRSKKTSLVPEISVTI